MPKKDPEYTIYSAKFDNELYSRIRKCAKVDCRSIRQFIIMACQEKVEKIEMGMEGRRLRE